MPGDIRFDDDEQFLALPLFPLEEGSKAILAADDRWEIPQTWLRDYETRPRYQRIFIHNVSIQSCRTEIERQNGIFVRRAAYLELFRPRKPYSISTMRQNVRFYWHIASYAIKLEKLISEISYDDLLQAIGSMAKVTRSRAPSAHDMMRWWRSVAPTTFTGYMAPPSMTREFAKPQHGNGFSTRFIRSDKSDDLASEKMFQPLPDEFVAKLGEFMIWVIDVLRPMHLDFLEELALLSKEPTKEQVSSTAIAFDWPDGFEVFDKTSAIRIGNICQASAIFLLSLLLGPRWSEVSSLSRECLKTLSDGTILLKGTTFKYSQNLSGDLRDWPLHPDLMNAILQQQRYIELTESDDFRFLWRINSTIFCSDQPIRQINSTLNKIAVAAGCHHLLQGTSFHHHRFRKTTARLIVIALHGGPVILRRLFGHQHLGVTLRYILANPRVIEELREVAESEHRALAESFVAKRDDLRGGGAAIFRDCVSRVISSADIYVPSGKRDQRSITTGDILDILEDQTAEGLSLKQIVPGLIACFKPLEEAGVCCTANDLPNIARCAMHCRWHVELPEYASEARSHVLEAIRALRRAKLGSLKSGYYEDILRQKLLSFPELAQEFSNNPIVKRFMSVNHDGQ